MANRLIETLPRMERSRMLALCKPVELTFGAILCKPDERYRYAYFPVTAIRYSKQIETQSFNALV